jgi:hypothetical protein
VEEVIKALRETTGGVQKNASLLPLMMFSLGAKTQRP